MSYHASYLYLTVSVLLLAALLFVPVRRIVWVLSVRRLQHRLGRELDAAGLSGQRVRAGLIAAVLSLGFSWLFHVSVIQPLYQAPLRQAAPP